MARPKMPLTREGFKTCAACKVEKPLDAFTFEPRVSSKTTARCSDCLYASHKAWAEANSDKVKVSRKRYVKKYPERVAAARAFSDRRAALERREARIENSMPLIQPRITEEGQYCTRCRRRKPTDEFGSNGWCRPCQAAAALKRLRESNAEQRERRRQQARKYDTERLYGIPFDELQARLANQDGKCAICCDEIDLLAKRSGCVDHCHTSLVVRGILCVKCNAGLGQFRDNEMFLARAIEYLKKSKETKMGMPRDYMTLNEEQFAKIVELLTPGYQLSMAYLAEMNHRRTMDAQQQAEAAARSDADERVKLDADVHTQAVAQENAEARARAEADMAAEAEKEAELRAEREANDRREAEEKAKRETAQREAAEMAELEAEEARQKAAGDGTAKRQLTPGIAE